MMAGSINLDSPDQTKTSSEVNGSRPNLSQQIEQSEKNLQSFYDNPTLSTSKDNYFLKSVTISKPNTKNLHSEKMVQSLYDYPTPSTSKDNSF